MKTNPSQYSGTLKNTICTICNESLNHLNRIEQDKHEILCRQQTRLI